MIYKPANMPDHISGLRVTVMGLGLHGGGLNSALFFSSKGAKVTVTDLNTRQTLKSSINSLKNYPVEYVLGRHEEQNFTDSDLIIKNPAVPADSPYLDIARSKGIPIETDLSVFLSLIKNPVIAVTGSKGKSTTASAIYSCLTKLYCDAKLGGNITVSPLTFINDLVAAPDAPVVLELSSWQLADLKGKGVLKPDISLITRIMPDHMDRYNSMSEYIADKKIIFQEQENNSSSIFNLDDAFQKDFHLESKAAPFFFSSHSKLPQGIKGAYIKDRVGKLHLKNFKNLNGIEKIGEIEENILPENIILPGEHNRMNLLCAGLALALFGIKAPIISNALSSFSGIEHRLELFYEYKGIRFYNDSAATIPQAAAAALKSISEPIFFITGGTDKNLDFTSLVEVISCAQEIFLIKGSATDKLIHNLKEVKQPFKGPFNSLKQAVCMAVEKASAGSSVLFSPGCASFGMFLNEFDRGRQFKKIVTDLFTD